MAPRLMLIDHHGAAVGDWDLEGILKDEQAVLELLQDEVMPEIARQAELES